MSRTTVPPAAVDLTGLVEMHVHSAPDLRPRYADDVETLRGIAAAGLRGVLLKSHVTLTADRAAIATRVVGRDAQAWGGLALNLAVGGLNPAAVEAALRLGAKQIWLPTLDAANHRREHGGSGGISTLDAAGKVLPTVKDILALVRQADIILGTGHLAAEETARVVKVARAMGLRKILVTHPEAPFVRMPVGMQKEIAGEGVFFERCFVNTTPVGGGTHPVTLAEIARQVRQVGVASTVLSTDFGQVESPSPAEGMRSYLSGLLEEGLAWADLRRMAQVTPLYLLGV
ncbi:MAG: DUF6282 family protein [Chloroflexota bacterium]